MRGKAETPIISIYVLDWSLRLEESEDWEPYPAVLLVWRDGSVLWSEDRVGGGPPYFRGRTSTDQVAEAIKTIEQTGAFEGMPWPLHFGFDSAFTTIAVCDGSRRLSMSSWHELFELNPKLVAASYGVTSLDGRNREDVIAAQPEDYRVFRETWKQIRDVTSSLIPAEGHPAGNVRLEVRACGATATATASAE